MTDEYEDLLHNLDVGKKWILDYKSKFSDRIREINISLPHEDSLNDYTSVQDC